ncbi:E3 ubiquitin-protein ligase PUB22-like [Salvia hispanica]|uniref:E3 ubiquitin-protein ligase PUB22-like n=1 Tax=Salvia hispanica TaxID=49212 RepID=UPI002009A583|nr:E3 ubiquitin-protein ligase PUB22-like [Salvia hispanica]
MVVSNAYPHWLHSGLEMEPKDVALFNGGSYLCLGVEGKDFAAIVAGESVEASEEALSILYSLRLSESALKSLASRSEFIACLIRLMQSPSYESRAYAVMMLESITEVEFDLINSNPQILIELIQILKDQICKRATRSALKMLITLCAWGRNRIKSAEAGLVWVVIDLLLDNSSDKRTSEMILTVLDLVCQCAEGRAELVRHGAGLAVVSKKILRVSEAASERAVRVLHSVSKFSGTGAVVQEMAQIGAVAKLCLVLQVECGMKTKERARDILKMHARAWRNSSCVPNTFASFLRY